MKKIILMIAIALGSFSYAQNISTAAVPSVVTSKFTSLYPNSKAGQWKNVNGNYETKFTQDKTKMCVVITPGGNVVKTTTIITVAELPKPVRDYIEKNYANQKITEACKTMEDDGKVKYEALVKDNHLCFDSDGNFVKSEKRKS
jgi:hypothetical protein